MIRVATRRKCLGHKQLPPANGPLGTLGPIITRRAARPNSHHNPQAYPSRLTVTLEKMAQPVFVKSVQG